MATPFVQAFADTATDTLAALPGSGLAWLDRARRAQLDAFVRDGLPGARNEAWKYTALRSLERRSFAPGDSAAVSREVDPAELDLPGVDGPRLVFVHGVFRPDLSRLDELADGLTLLPLSEALSEALAGDAEPLRFFLTHGWEHQADAFARLNAALAGDGMVLRVAAGTRLERPVHLLHVGVAAETELAWHVRNIIELGEGAFLHLVEQHAGNGKQRNLGTQVSDVVLRKGAELDWVILQDAAEGSTLIRRNKLRMDAETHTSMHVLELGGSLVRHELDAELKGDGARLDTRGVFIPRGRQHLDTHLDIRHASTHTASDALWRGVADERGRGVFHGQIIVDPGADGTDANLTNKNLLLSPHAEIDTQPVLEIYADEVLAAHGATVGQLDPQALFYLQARGIPMDEARRILTAAFCSAALSTLPIEALREYCEQRLVERLPADVPA